MEINFLVFPAPRCTFTEDDLKGKLIWIPYNPNLFKQGLTSTHLFRSTSQSSQPGSPQRKPMTRAMFAKQKPLNPPEQQPNDLSCTIYDDALDEDVREKFCSPKNVEVYRSGTFTSKNLFSESRKMFNQIQQIKHEEQSVDLSVIQAEEMIQEQRPSQRITDLLKPRTATNSLKQLDLQGSIYQQLANQTRQSNTPMLATSTTQSNLLTKFQTTKKHSKKEIPCLYLKSPVQSRYLMLYFHGNGEDIYQSLQLLETIKAELKINILAVEYPGYGIYAGSPSEDAILKDANYVYQYLTKHSGIEEKNIIVFGRSIGTGFQININFRPATYLAGTFNPALLVLMSPFLSLREVIKHSYGQMASQLIQERFKNKENIQNVQCPTFILHGMKDRVIPVWHSQTLKTLCQGQCELRTPLMMDHVRFVFQDDLTNPLKEFMRANNLVERQPQSVRRFIH